MVPSGSCDPGRAERHRRAAHCRRRASRSICAIGNRLAADRLARTRQPRAPCRQAGTAVPHETLLTRFPLRSVGHRQTEPGHHHARCVAMQPFLTDRQKLRTSSAGSSDRLPGRPRPRVEHREFAKMHVRVPRHRSRAVVRSLSSPSVFAASRGSVRTDAERSAPVDAATGRWNRDDSTKSRQQLGRVVPRVPPTGRVAAPRGGVPDGGAHGHTNPVHARRLRRGGAERRPDRSPASRPRSPRSSARALRGRVDTPVTIHSYGRLRAGVRRTVDRAASSATRSATSSDSEAGRRSSSAVFKPNTNADDGVATLSVGTGAKSSTSSRRHPARGATGSPDRSIEDTSPRTTAAPTPPCST